MSEVYPEKKQPTAAQLARASLELRGLRPPAGDGYDDLESQLQCAMGDDVDPGWAPAVIEIIRRRHPQLWDSALAAATTRDHNRTEM